MTKTSTFAYGLTENAGHRLRACKENGVDGMPLGADRLKRSRPIRMPPLSDRDTANLQAAMAVNRVEPRAIVSVIGDGGFFAP